MLPAQTKSKGLESGSRIHYLKVIFRRRKRIDPISYFPGDQSIRHELEIARGKKPTRRDDGMRNAKWDFRAWRHVAKRVYF